MLLTNSTKLAIVLILTLTLLDNEIVSTDDTVTYSAHNMFSEADQCKQKVIEQGSTLTLTCLAIKLESYSQSYKDYPTDNLQWTTNSNGKVLMR